MFGFGFGKGFGLGLGLGFGFGFGLVRLEVPDAQPLGERHEDLLRLLREGVLARREAEPRGAVAA